MGYLPHCERYRVRGDVLGELLVRGLVGYETGMSYHHEYWRFR